MFATFAQYIDPLYAREHATIFLQTPTKKWALKARWISVIAGWDAVKRTDFADSSDLQEWAQKQFESAKVTLAADIEDLEKLYTFATCSYHFAEDERTLVYASECSQVKNPDALFSNPQLYPSLKADAKTEVPVSCSIKKDGCQSIHLLSTR